MGRRRHRRRRTSRRPMMSNASDKPESEPNHIQGAQAKTSLNKSNAGTADAGQYQRTQTVEAAESASSVESGESGNENNLETFDAKASDTLDMDNVCCEFPETDTTVGGKGATQEGREDTCPTCVTVSAAGHRSVTEDNGDEARSKFEDHSIARGKGATKDSGGEAGSKCAADSSAGGKDRTQDKVAKQQHVEAPDVVSARKAVTKSSVQALTMGNKDAEMVSVTDPDVHMTTLSDSDVAMVSVSDPDVTMRTVSDTDAEVMPVSLMCLKCHSQLGPQICGVHNVGPAQRVEAVTLPALALTRREVLEEIQEFWVAPEYRVLQASAGMQMCNVLPSGQLRPPTTTSSFSVMPMPSAIQMFGTTTSAQQQSSMVAPPPYLTQSPWEIQMCNMPPERATSTACKCMVAELRTGTVWFPEARLRRRHAAAAFCWCGSVVRRNI
ncbi:hypothetical protein MTO96_045960 [Rhipicephalus appendiculatus]